MIGRGIRDRGSRLLPLLVCAPDRAVLVRELAYGIGDSTPQIHQACAALSSRALSPYRFSIRLAARQRCLDLGCRRRRPRTMNPMQRSRPGIDAANHASTHTTQLYDRRRDEVSLDEVERIVI